MKKTYINPEMEIMKLTTLKMLAASVPGGGETDQNLGHEDSDDFDW